MKRIFYFLVVVSSFFFISCQKEVSVDGGSGGNGGGTNTGGGGASNGGGSGSNPKLIGEWKYISQDAALKSTVQYKVPGSGETLKSVTITNYTTLDNSGGMKIEVGKMYITDMTYRVATTSQVELYMNNVLENTTTSPWNYTMPAYNSEGDYELIGTDTIHFTNTTFEFVQGGTMPSGPSKLKYVIEGNKLKLFSDYKESKTETQQGITAQVLHEVKLTLNYEKK